MIREALVVGAGPAGLSAAIGLRRRGVEVRLRERALRWTGRVCGGFLSAEAVRHLDWLGVDSGGAVPVTAVRITAWFGLDRTVPLPAPGLAWPRRALEERLLDRALREGVPRPSNEPASGAAAVLAAGRFKGEAPPPHAGGWYGWNAVFEGLRARPGDMSLHFLPGAYVGTLAFSDGTANVSGLVYKEGTTDWEETFAAARERLPALAELLGEARRASDWRGVGPLPHAADLPDGPGPIPVGDAAAVGDPFFGEGLGRALAAGPMLFQAWGEADPAAAHRRLWRAAFRRRLLAGGILRALLRRPLPLRAALALSVRATVLGWMPHLR